MSARETLIEGWLRQLADLRAAAAFGKRAEIQFAEAARAFKDATGKDPEPLIADILPSVELSAAILELEDAL